MAKQIIFLAGGRSSFIVPDCGPCGFSSFFFRFCGSFPSSKLLCFQMLWLPVPFAVLGCVSNCVETPSGINWNRSHLVGTHDSLNKIMHFLVWGLDLLISNASALLREICLHYMLII